MGIVFACIAPHGAEMIPELARNMLQAFAITRKGMEQIAETLKKQEVETIVVATPHNLRLEATIGIITAEFSDGILEENNSQVKLRCQCDSQLARVILAETRNLGLPVVGVNYGTSEGPASCMPMDWGTLIPLWFFAREKQATPKVVIVTPSREIPLENLTRLGHAIAEAAKTSDRRVAFVASADQGHAHRSDGPYGFNAASAEFDQAAKMAIQKNDLRPLLNLPPKFVEDAKPDSIWQIAILQGILERVPMKGFLLSYQAPTYYGMLCAEYLPEKNVTAIK
jgi:aromatic ring-opening dioxygenase LigB subunit